ncbi:MAG TPA: hypothetical protein VGB50_10735 [Flavobacterium sp.]
MKFASTLLMSMFLLFLSVPTIVSLIKKSSDTSVFFSMTEEEQAHKEIKADIKPEVHSVPFLYSKPKKELILSENLSRHDNVAGTIFIPPPENI